MREKHVAMTILTDISVIEHCLHDGLVMTESVLLYVPHGSEIRNNQCDLFPPESPMSEAYKQRVSDSLLYIPTNEWTGSFNRTRDDQLQIVNLIPRREPRCKSALIRAVYH